MLWFLLIVLLFVLALLVLASRRPGNFHVERSIDIGAPADRIFPLINDFRQWDAWSPFNKDPAMRKTYGGSASGVGATYAWEGNKQVGRGEIAITESVPPRKVAFDLHMIAPFEGRNVATFTLAPAGDSTRVTWSLDDRHNLMLKMIGMLVNLDGKIGADFETGLARMKSAAEQARP